MESPKHRQVEVQGVLVDEGIAGLLRRLWARDMQTDASCQGGPGSAYLMFSFLEDAVDFLKGSIEALDFYGFDLAPFSSPDGPRGRVIFPPEAIGALEEVW
ncbi:hypothetical protein PBI_GAIA_79 [Mycobacterium phage Gaia]|uniref:Uncharacterized protein n=1 Tax=Mycobacterium phage Gaia TaxID=1486472 RepID=A0A068F3H9_9CAUD|nr:hypothetical protein VC46_gp154 [Mycobacterium phage Gaia]AID58898.1 hypothetical protein PBI_GAIA_79 [Mycobacterium phage Gaia]AYR00017.1 hypothetical protein PBI_NEBKISS_78 [Mycobacterium phage Nebkiss]